MDNINEVILGAGEVYMLEADNLTEIPADDVIETEENNVGHCSGGFSLDYKPEVYDVKNQYNKTVKRFIISEACTAKTGLLTWNLARLALLSTAKFTEEVKDGKVIRKLVIGGSNNSLKTVLFRFVHKKADGNNIRFTMFGQGGNGFALEFTTKELSVDAQLEAIEHIKNYLFDLTEEVSSADVTSVTLNHDTLSMNVGDKEAIVATVTPNEALQDVAWSTSDEKKATVKDGVIEAIAAGQVTITATSSLDSSKKATCTITISE